MRKIRSLLLLTLVMALGTALALSGGAKADDKKEPAAKERVKADPAVSIAALAAQTAMEGQKRKSPTLMLAAAELLGGLKEGDRAAKGAKNEIDGKEAKNDPKAFTMNVADWVDQAKEYAKGDAELSAFLDKRVKQLSSRGIIYNQGKDKPEIQVPGVGTFKMVYSNILTPGFMFTGSNYIFEAAKPGCLAVVDETGALDLFVYDGVSGALIGQDTSSNKAHVVTWFQAREGPITFKVKNNSNVQQRYTVLVNW